MIRESTGQMRMKEVSLEVSFFCRVLEKNRIAKLIGGSEILNFEVFTAPNIFVARPHTILVYYLR